MTTRRWTIDPTHSGIHFTIRHMVFAKVRGQFGAFQGTVDFDEARPLDTKISVRIDAASIDTNEAKRDAHLRSADFFDVEKFPALTFDSTKVEQKNDGYLITGELTIHGVTKTVVLEAATLGGGTDPWGNKRHSFEASTTINRKDFGLTWNQALEAGGILVGEEVKIALEVEAIAAQSAEQAA